MNPEVKAAILTARVTALCAILAVAAQGAFYFLAVRDKYREELMQHRREALILALEVVDHVYANTSFNGNPPANPHEWDISLARNAMNEMIIYCKDPNSAVAAFTKASGIINPDKRPSGLFGIRDLAAFRNVLCKELEVSSIQYTNSNIIWINGAPGGK